MYLKLIILTFLYNIFFVFAGYFLLKILTRNNFTIKSFYSLFISFFVGFYTIVWLYILIKTRLNTVFVLLVIPLFFVKKFSPNTDFSTKETNFIKLTIYFIITTLFTSFYMLLPFVIKKGALVPHEDFLFWSSISKNLEFNKENYFNTLNLFFDNIGQNPYHYFELWANKLISATNNFSILYNLIIILPTVLMSLFIIGVLAIFEDFKINKYYLFIIVFLIGPLYIPLLYKTFGKNMIGFFDSSSPFSIWGNRQLIIYNIIIISFLLFLKNKKFETFLFIISVILLFNVAFIAIPFAIILYYIIFRYILKKQKISIYVFLLSIILLVLYTVFYILQLPKLDNAFSNSFLNLNFLNIRHSLGFAAWAIFYLTVIYSIFLFYLIYFKKLKNENFINFITFFTILLLTGFIGMILSSGLRDNIQFFSLLFTFVIVALITTTIKIISFNDNKTKYILAFICIISAYNAYHYTKIRVALHENLKELNSKNFLKEVEKKIKENNIELVALIPDSNVIKKFSPYTISNSKMSKYLYLYDVVDFVYLSNTKIKTLINEKPFSDNPNLKIVNNDSILSFIKQYKIKACIVAKDSYYKFDDSIIKTQIIDSISGEKFYLLKVQ